MQIDKPISTRVSRIVVAAVTIGISVSVGAFLVSDFRQSIKAATSSYQSAAFAFAAASSDGVAERDVRKALEVIRGVRNLPEVDYVAALDPQGNVIAEIGAGARLLGGQSGWLPVPTRIEVVAEVRKAGSPVGSIVMRAEAKDLLERYLNAALYTGLMGGALVLATAFFAKVHVKRVVRPLRDLSEQFLDIGKRSDLTRRLSKERNDEVGVLVDAFNEMFGHIDERDRLLQKHRETLEETVEARTIQLRVAKDEADAANAAKSTFLATMSHEIRTPMNGMMVMAEMLSAAPLSPRHQRYAEIITRSGKNLVHIINDILDFSKIESGKIELEEIEFSFDAVIEDVACLFAERAREKGLSLAIFIAPDVPVSVIGDPVRLTQVVSNLVNNGLKFTDAGGVSINVKSSADARRVIVSVEDTGIGIAADQIDRIFTRFSQADSSITRKFGGTGLGLSISKQLTELMGGTVVVESIVGQGSRFIVEIPLTVIEPALALTSARPAVVVLYDDDVVSRQSVARGLEARGIEVLETVRNPCDAILVRVGTKERMPELPSSMPIVLLRPFAATSNVMPDGLEPTAEIPLPLSRKALDRLCTAIQAGDLADIRFVNDEKAARAAPDLSHLQVLAVDDVAVNREVLAEALRSFNIHCELSDSGQDAIAKVRAKSYDIVFMDCSMPGLDGFEATREIRAIEAGSAREPAVVIALTGHVMGKDSGAWKDCGMNGYLAKPFNMGQLSIIFRDAGFKQETSVAAAISQDDGEPLLSTDTMAMFEAIRTSTGTDLRAKVFEMFRASAIEAYRCAAEEISKSGPDSKRLVHALKSNCSSAGAARATSICQAMETTLSSGGDIDLEDLRMLQHVLHATIAAMADLETLKTEEAA